MTASIAMKYRGRDNNAATRPRVATAILAAFVLAACTGPVDAQDAAVPCTRDGFCSGHGNATATVASRAFAAADVSTAWTPASQSGHRRQFRAASAECTCACDTGYTGDRCDACMVPNADPAAACLRCLPGFAGFPSCTPMATAMTTATPPPETTTATSTSAPVSTTAASPPSTTGSAAESTTAEVVTTTGSASNTATASATAVATSTPAATATGPATNGTSTTPPAVTTATAAPITTSSQASMTTTTTDVVVPTTTTAAPTTTPPPPTALCTVAANCTPGNTAAARLDTATGACSCECRDQWFGALCTECGAQFLRNASCARCVPGRLGYPACRAATMVTAAVDSEPTTRAAVPLSAAGVRFWLAASATSLAASFARSPCRGNGVSLVVNVRDVLSSETTAASTTSGDGESSTAVLRLVVLVSVLGPASDGAAAAPLTAAQADAEAAAVAAAARCVSGYFDLPRRFLPLNANGTAGAPGADATATPWGSDYYVPIADANVTSVSDESPCGENVCATNAVASAAALPPDPAAAPADAGGDDDSGLSGVLIVVIIAAVLLALVGIAFLVRRFLQQRRKRIAMRRQTHGIRFCDAAAAEMPLLDLPLHEAQAIVADAALPPHEREAAQRRRQMQAQQQRLLVQKEQQPKNQPAHTTTMLHGIPAVSSACPSVLSSDDGAGDAAHPAPGRGQHQQPTAATAWRLDPSTAETPPQQHHDTPLGASRVAPPDSMSDLFGTGADGLGSDDALLGGGATTSAPFTAAQQQQQQQQRDEPGNASIATEVAATAGGGVTPHPPATRDPAESSAAVAALDNDPLLGTADPALETTRAAESAEVPPVNDEASRATPPTPLASEATRVLISDGGGNDSAAPRVPEAAAHPTDPVRTADPEIAAVLDNGCAAAGDTEAAAHPASYSLPPSPAAAANAAPKTTVTLSDDDLL